MKQISLSIPKPCHENWDGMTQEDKGRFCAACQKTIVDFSAMSDREVAQFFKKPVGSVCGRFDGSQLNRVVEVPRKRLPWIKYFFTIALPAFLFSKKAAAQGEVRRTETKLQKKACVAVVGGVRKRNLNELKKDAVKPETLLMGKLLVKTQAESLKTFKGRVVNAKGEAVPFATIAAKKEGRTVVADSNGAFAIAYVSLPLLLEASSVGYRPQTTLYDEKDSPQIVLQPVEGDRIKLGAIVVTSVHKKKNAALPMLPPTAGAAFSEFSVYPNPVNANGVLTVDLKNIEAGKYNLTIVSSNGSVVHSQLLIVEKGKTKQTVALQNPPPGIYFIRLSTGRNANSFTEKILVE